MSCEITPTWNHSLSLKSCVGHVSESIIGCHGDNVGMIGYHANVVKYSLMITKMFHSIANYEQHKHGIKK